MRSPQCADFKLLINITANVVVGGDDGSYAAFLQSISNDEDDGPVASDGGDGLVIIDDQGPAEESRGAMTPRADQNGTAATATSDNATAAAPPPPDDTPGKRRFTVPEPPRWRFVNEAKKTSGYSSVAAGQFVKGER